MIIIIANVRTEAARRKFFRFFTGFQQLVNTLLVLQMLRMGSLIQLYELDELESIYWCGACVRVHCGGVDSLWAHAFVCRYIGYLHRDLDQWKEQLEGARQRVDDKKKDKNAKAKAAKAKAPKAKIITHHDLVRAAEAGLARGVYFTLLALHRMGTFVPPVYELQPKQNRWQLRFNAVLPGMVPQLVRPWLVQAVALTDSDGARCRLNVIRPCERRIFR